jgi:hypothetical protein
MIQPIGEQALLHRQFFKPLQGVLDVSHQHPSSAIQSQSFPQWQVH